MMAQSPLKMTRLGAPGWLSQLRLRLLILAQIMLSRFVRLNLMLGSVLTARSLLGIPSHPHILGPSLAPSKIN